MTRRLALLPTLVSITACGASTSPTTGPTTLTSVSVACSATSIAIGQTTQCTATARFSDGSSASATTGVTWQSSNAQIATVGGSTGLVTGVSSGGNVITATFQNVSGATTVTVTSTPLIATLQTVCPGLSPIPPPTVCLANLETDLDFTTSGTADASYLVAFGDGQTCGPSLTTCNAQLSGFPHTRTWFPHTYAAGVFTARLTITDVSGQATATAAVTVRSLSGTWISGSGSDGCTGQRILQLMQTGTSLTGTYTNAFGNSSAIGSGSSVNSLRDVTVNMPSTGLVFSGLFIDGHGVNVDASALILQITVGDPTCGQPILTFRRQ